VTSPGPDPQRCGARVLELARDAGTLTIVAPFITTPGIEPILSVLPAGCALEVYTRWRPDEVAAGASDPLVLDLVTQRGGMLRLQPTLHAKAYVSDTRALVGSANATVTGLGWHGAGAVELLVDTPADDPALTVLLRLLASSSSTATTADRDAVIEAATLLPRPAAIAKQVAAVESLWLPSYRLPDVLWRVYTGQREQSLAELVAPDLTALGLPPGLRTEADFNMYVASILRQGLTGRLAQECSNLTAAKAIDRLIEVTEAAGLHIDEPAEVWETLAQWLGHFLPSYRRIWGGTRLIG
jgi:hypothetical protein